MAARRPLRQAMTHSPRRDQPLISPRPPRPPDSTSLLPFIPPCAVSPFIDQPRVFGFSITRLLRAARQHGRVGEAEVSLILPYVSL